MSRITRGGGTGGPPGIDDSPPPATTSPPATPQTPTTDGVDKPPVHLEIFGRNPNIDLSQRATLGVSQDELNDSSLKLASSGAVRQGEFTEFASLSRVLPGHQNPGFTQPHEAWAVVVPVAVFAVATLVFIVAVVSVAATATKTETSSSGPEPPTTVHGGGGWESQVL